MEDQQEVSGPSTTVLLKLSGDAFAPTDTLRHLDGVHGLIARELADVVDLGVQCAVVVGGGNIFRGRQAPGIDRSRADYMGMLATVMNASRCRTRSRRSMCRRASRRRSTWRRSRAVHPALRAIRHLEKGRVVIFAAGIGAPFFSTDTTAAQRARDRPQAILKGTKVDGVYTADPDLDPSGRAVRDDRVPRRCPARATVMDATAISLGMENGMPIIVFDFRPEGNIRRVVSASRSGRWSTGGGPVTVDVVAERGPREDGQGDRGAQGRARRPSGRDTRPRPCCHD